MNHCPPTISQFSKQPLRCNFWHGKKIRHQNESQPDESIVLRNLNYFSQHELRSVVEDKRKRPLLGDKSERLVFDFLFWLVLLERISFQSVEHHWGNKFDSVQYLL